MRSLSSQMLIIPGASHHPRRAHERGADCTDWLSAHVAVRETDLAAAIRQGRNRAATPRSRPAPPPPGTDHGSRREEPTAESTSGNRSRRSRFRRPDAIPRRLPCLE
jgi:hypothetical protein